MSAGRRAAILSIAAALLAGCRTAPGVEIEWPKIGAGGDKPPYGTLDPEDVLGRARGPSGRAEGPVPSSRVELPVIRLPVVGVSRGFAMVSTSQGPQTIDGGTRVAMTHLANRTASSSTGAVPGTVATGRPPAGFADARPLGSLGSMETASASGGPAGTTLLSGDQPMSEAGSGGLAAALEAARRPAAQWVSRGVAVEASGLTAGTVASARPPHEVTGPLSAAALSAPDRVSEAAGPERSSEAAGAGRAVGAGSSQSPSAGFSDVSFAGAFSSTSMAGQAGTLRITGAGGGERVGEATIEPPKAMFREPAPTPAVAPEGPPLLLLKTADRAQVEPGDVVAFTIEYRNLRPWPIKDLVIQDRLSLALRYVSGSAAPGGAGFAVGDLPGGNEVLEWRIPGPVAPGAGGTLTFRARVR